MTTLDELNRFLDASLRDPNKEPEFFHALLDATLYAHAPLHDDSEQLRLVMFRHPIDHTFTVPVFTDEAKAEFAARGNVRIVSMSGRLLLEITHGASLTINPNDNWLTLYPEEANELLAHGTLPPIYRDQFHEDEAKSFKLNNVPAPLAKALRKSLPKLPGVEVAYVAGIRWSRDGRPDSLLIALGGTAHGSEREVRATATLLHPVFERIDRPVEMMHFNMADPKPDWIQHLGLKPVYRRKAGRPSPISKYN